MAFDKSLNEIWTEIADRHWKYSETEENMEKINERQKLETYLRRYLYFVPHDRKFFLPETTHVLKKSIISVSDFSSLKLSNGFESISQYANNLFIKPWRKEYRTIKMYSGFYQHDIKSNLVDAESLFLAMGYKLTSNQTLTLEGAICPDQVMNVSRDAMIAYVECQIMKEIYSDLTSMQIQCTWQDIFAVRENFIGDVKQAIKILTTASHDRLNRKMKITSPDNCYNPNKPQSLVTCNSCSMRQPLKLAQAANMQYCNHPCSMSQPSNIYEQHNHYSSYMPNLVGQPPIPPLPPMQQHQTPIISHSKSMDHYDQNLMLQQQQQQQHHHQQRHSFDYNYLQQMQQSLPQQMLQQNHQTFDAIDGMMPSQYNNHHHNNQQQVPNCNNNYNHPYNVSGNRYPLPYNLSNTYDTNNYMYNNNTTNTSNNTNNIYKMQQSTAVQVPPESMNYNYNNVYHTIATQTTPISPLNGYIPNSFPHHSNNIDVNMSSSNINCDNKNSILYSGSLIDLESSNAAHNNVYPTARRNKKSNPNIIDMDNLKSIMNHNHNHQSDNDDSYDDYHQQQKFQQSLVSNTNNTINSKNHDGIGSYESWNYVFQNLEQQGYSKDLGERGDLVDELDLERMHLADATGGGATTTTSTSIGTSAIMAPHQFSDHNGRTMNSTAAMSSNKVKMANKVKTMDNMHSSVDCYENVPKHNSIKTTKPQVQKANGSLPNSKHNINNNNVNYIKSSENHIYHLNKKPNINDNTAAKTTMAGQTAESSKTKTMLSNTSNNVKKNVRIDVTSTGSAALANKSKEWNCKFCTFLNPEGKRICEMCAKSRDFTNDSSNSTATCV